MSCRHGCSAADHLVRGQLTVCTRTRCRQAVWSWPHASRSHSGTCGCWILGYPCPSRFLSLYGSMPSLPTLAQSGSSSPAVRCVPSKVNVMACMYQPWRIKCSTGASAQLLQHPFTQVPSPALGRVRAGAPPQTHTIQMCLCKWWCPPAAVRHPQQRPCGRPVRADGGTGRQRQTHRRPEADVHGVPPGGGARGRTPPRRRPPSPPLRAPHARGGPGRGLRSHGRRGPGGRRLGHVTHGSAAGIRGPHPATRRSHSSRPCALWPAACVLWHGGL